MLRGEPRERYEAERESNRAIRANPFKITITTWVPTKWRFVDLETGDVFRTDGSRYWKDEELSKGGTREGFGGAQGGG